MESPRPSLIVEQDRTSTSTTAETLTSQTKINPRFTPEPFILSTRDRNRRYDSMKFDDYFLGPRELDRHSKWPMLLRIHGSCLPELVLPLLFVGAWTTVICLISRHVQDLGISSTLLTVLGFVVALSLSFRSSTAYERYMEGRKAWSMLMMTSHNLARNIWINAKEREESAAEDLLGKVTALNLIVAYARALKHRLRFEPYTHYSDIHDLVQHLDTYAKEATSLEPHRDDDRPKSAWRSWGEYLGVSFALSNPRKVIKRAHHPLGNLPVEILSHLTVYLHDIIDDHCFGITPYHTQALNSVLVMNDVLVSTERILNTPLPLAYAIAISQLTWVYILILPFQLYNTLGMVAIPGTLFAAYIIFGFAFIGQEIENPFGHDVNDLPLDSFCDQIAADIDIIAASTPKKSEGFVKNERNSLMHPLNNEGYDTWKTRSVDEIRDALRKRSLISMKSIQPVKRRRGRVEHPDGKYEMVTSSARDIV